MGWGSGGIVGSFMGLGSKGGASGPGFKHENGLILCSSGDFVCGIAPNLGGSTGGAKADSTGGSGHLSYGSDGSIPKAVAFIAQRVQ
jgi:hypothetical protein